MKKVFLLATIAVLALSCSTQPEFEIAVNTGDNDFKNRNFVVSSFVRGEEVFSETTKMKGKNFSVKIPYTEPQIMFASIPGTFVNNLMFVTDTVGPLQIDIAEDRAYISGTPLNDKLTQYAKAEDSVRIALSELNANYDAKRAEHPDSANIYKAEYRAERRRIIDENTTRSLDFMKENIDNPVGEYFFMIHYGNALPENQEKMKAFASDKLREEMNLN